MSADPESIETVVTGSLEDALQTVIKQLDRRISNLAAQPDTQALQMLYKVVKYTAMYAPVLSPNGTSLRGQAAIVTDICFCKDDPVKLEELAHVYLHDLVGPIKAAGGRTRPPTVHPTRDSDDEHRAENESMVVSPKRNQVPMKRLAMQRDGARCVLSGVLDAKTYAAAADKYPNETRAETLVLAHILPFSLNKGDTEAERKKSGQVWNIITMFSGVEQEHLRGNKINRLENVLMLSLELHNGFGELGVWLEAVEGQPHQYRIKKASPSYLPQVHADSVITLKNHSDNGELALPDPALIQLHAACAKIAHASGAAEYIEAFIRDYEEVTTLSSDGSSYELLFHALSLVSVPIAVQ